MDQYRDPLQGAPPVLSRAGSRWLLGGGERGRCRELWHLTLGRRRLAS